jgi:hypothetical protein
LKPAQAGLVNFHQTDLKKFCFSKTKQKKLKFFTFIQKFGKKTYFVPSSRGKLLQFRILNESREDIFDLSPSVINDFEIGQTKSLKD